jgi:hypothetical protein
MSQILSWWSQFVSYDWELVIYKKVTGWTFLFRNSLGRRRRQDHHSFCVHFDGFWPKFKSSPPTNTVRDKYWHLQGLIYMVTQTSHAIKFTIGWPPRIVSNLELKGNRQFYRLLAELITNYFPAPPMTNGNNYMYEINIHILLLYTPTTYTIISMQLQIKYIRQIKLDFEKFL